MKYTLLILSVLLIGALYSFGFENSDQITIKKSSFFSFFGLDSDRGDDLKSEQKQKSDEVDMGCH